MTASAQKRELAISLVQLGASRGPAPITTPYFTHLQLPHYERRPLLSHPRKAEGGARCGAGEPSRLAGNDSTER